MHDELTAVDIKKMQEEVDYRMCVLRPQLLAEVQRTREYGDLSENAEYKEAKRDALKARRRKWQPVLLPGKSHGRRSLVGYSLWSRKELNTIERLHFLSSF